jgi:hypothetical protein
MLAAIPAATAMQPGPTDSFSCGRALLGAVDTALRRNGGRLVQVRNVPYAPGVGLPPGFDSRSFDAVVAAAAEGDNPFQNFNAFLAASAANAMGIVVPEYGVVIRGGSVEIDGHAYATNEIVEAARDHDIQDVIVGPGMFAGLGHLLGNPPFLSSDAAVSAGLDSNNFARVIARNEDLRKLWFVDYRRTLVGNPPTNGKAIDEALNEAWPRIDRFWRLRRAAMFVHHFDSALNAQLASGGYQCGDDALAPPVVRPAPPPPPRPGPPLTGTVFTLIATKPDAPYATWTVRDRQVTQTLAATQGSFEWDAMPPDIGSGGYSITLSVTGTAKPGQRISAGITANGGMTYDPSPAHVDVLAESATKKASVTVKMTPPATATPGSTIKVRIGADYGPGVWYWYEAK